jgi:hypothetical protein
MQTKKYHVDLQELETMWAEGVLLTDLAEHFHCPVGHIGAIFLRDRRKAWIEKRQPRFPERVWGRSKKPWLLTAR